MKIVVQNLTGRLAYFNLQVRVGAYFIQRKKFAKCAYLVKKVNKHLHHVMHLHAPVITL